MQPFPNQPHYPPSEIYVPEQPQGYTPPVQPSSAGQEIVISYKKLYIKTYIYVCKILFFVLSALFIGLAGFALISAFSPTLAQDWGSTIHSGDIPPLVLSFVVILAAIALLAWWNKRLSSSTGPAYTPVLHITREGFRIQNALGARRSFIRWDELQTVYAQSTFLKIRSAAPLSMSNPTLPRRSRTSVISLIYLDTPGQEILRQLVQFYPNELSRYNIQFQP